MDRRILQLALLERRQREVAVDLVVRARQRRHRVGMAELDGERVELGGVLGPEGLLGGDLEQHRLRGDLHGGQGDLVLAGEVAEGLHVRVAGEQQHRRGADAAQALHVAPRPVVEQQHVGGAAVDDVDIAREQRVVAGGAARQVDPLHRDVPEAGGLGVLLDQLVLLGEDGGQVDEARLPADPHLGVVGPDGGGERQPRQQEGRSCPQEPAAAQQQRARPRRTHHDASPCDPGGFVSNPDVSFGPNGQVWVGPPQAPPPRSANSGRERP
ncbi:hypothetical protein, partial [Methylobacterium sp. B1]|uniref:hypothetical protein n=1 Tax=Methylobacterium sp. B1 TaxID=91459 RepID=UPI0035B51A28